jgi:hypothetical protein
MSLRESTRPGLGEDGGVKADVRAQSARSLAQTLFLGAVLALCSLAPLSSTPPQGGSTRDRGPETEE